jgi:hypothetical protein
MGIVWANVPTPWVFSIRCFRYFRQKNALSTSRRALPIPPPTPAPIATPFEDPEDDDGGGNEVELDAVDVEAAVAVCDLVPATEVIVVDGEILLDDEEAALRLK